MNLSSGFIALFAFSLLTAGCTSSVSTSSKSQPNSDTAIIHGKKSLSSDPIAQATVSVNTGSGKCTGVLLSDRVVLTAAHCFDFEPVELSRAKITILSGDKTQECISAAVSEVSYEPSAVVVGGVHQPDLALLKLTSAVCKTVDTVLGHPLKLDDVVSVSGFGTGTEGNQPDTMEIKVIDRDPKNIEALNSDLDPKIADEAEQLEATKGFASVMKHYLFAVPVSKGQSLCHGDSGGPVFTMVGGSLQIVGINGAVLPNSKKGVPECRSAYFQLFTPVAPFSHWIQDKLTAWK